jgi:UDP-N-acetylglucosamine:LPS N-acetylglucosamine transferase
VGYGGFVEAAAHGIPVLYVDRPDWPETPHLRDWLERHGNCGAIGEEELFNEEIGRRLEQLWALPARKAVVSDGARYAARRLKELLN